MIFQSHRLALFLLAFSISSEALAQWIEHTPSKCGASGSSPECFAGWSGVGVDGYAPRCTRLLIKDCIGGLAAYIAAFEGTHFATVSPSVTVEPLSSAARQIHPLVNERQVMPHARRSIIDREAEGPLGHVTEPSIRTWQQVYGRTTRTGSASELNMLPLSSLDLKSPKSGEETSSTREGNQFFRISQAAFATSQALDLASNWSGPEANALLASDGRMAWKGRGIKIGFTTGALLLQEAIVRKWPASRRYLAWFNFGVSVPTAAVAVRNWRLP